MQPLFQHGASNPWEAKDLALSNSETFQGKLKVGFANAELLGYVPASRACIILDSYH